MSSFHCFFQESKLQTECSHVMLRVPQVALQFPDQLLCDSVAVTTILARESGRECVILGDTSYGR